MGAIPLHTCTPYQCGFFPLKNQHVAWGESSAIILANSLFGAKTNREGGPSALASAITGKTPNYGYHLESQRKATVEVKVKKKMENVSDFGAMGYYIGSLCQERIPVFTGIPFALNIEQYKTLGAALASSGSIAVFHVLGQTPLGNSVKEYLGYLEPEEVIEFGDAEKEEAFLSLTSVEDKTVEMVALGCPHASLLEIKEVAEYLESQKSKCKADLWVMTSFTVKQTADYLGYTNTIEKSGGRLVSDTCLVLGALGPVIKKRGYHNIATNSAKLAHYVPGQWSLGCYFGSLTKCLKTALSGKWESE